MLGGRGSDGTALRARVAAHRGRTLRRQQGRDGASDSLGRRLGLPVADVRLAERHPGLRMAEQTRYHRQRHGLHHGVAGEGMALIPISE